MRALRVVIGEGTFIGNNNNCIGPGWIGLEHCYGHYVNLPFVGIYVSVHLNVMSDVVL